MTGCSEFKNKTKPQQQNRSPWLLRGRTPPDQQANIAVYAFVWCKKVDVAVDVAVDCDLTGACLTHLYPHVRASLRLSLLSLIPER